MCIFRGKKIATLLLNNIAKGNTELLRRTYCLDLNEEKLIQMEGLWALAVSLCPATFAVLGARPRTITGFTAAVLVRGVQEQGLQRETAVCVNTESDLVFQQDLGLLCQMGKKYGIEVVFLKCFQGF